MCSTAGHIFSFTLPTGWQLACCWFGGAGQMQGFWVRKPRYSHTGDAWALGYGPVTTFHGAVQGCRWGLCVLRWLHSWGQWMRGLGSSTAQEGSPGPVGDPASPWRPWTAGRALTDGPGSGSGLRCLGTPDTGRAGAWLVPREPSRL